MVFWSVPGLMSRRSTYTSNFDFPSFIVVMLSTPRNSGSSLSHASCTLARLVRILVLREGVHG